MTTDPFRGLLDPFAWWDIGQTYDKYNAFFDVVIFSAIFIALAQAILGRKFPRRPGRALSAALGIFMGVGLTLLEQQFGWNLRMAGGVAAVIVMIIFAMLMMPFLLQFNLNKRTAGTLVFLILYFMLKALSPAAIRFINEYFPFLNLLAAIAVIYGFWLIIRRVLPNDASAVFKTSDAGMVARLDQPREKSELHLLKKTNRKAVPEAKKNAKQIEHTLQALRNEIQKPNPNFKQIAQATATIAHRADSAVAKIDKLRILDRRLRNFDWHELQQMRNYCRELGEADREKLKQQLLLERKKILEEHAIEQTISSCENLYSNLRSKLDGIGRAALAKNKAETVAAINTALQLDSQLKGMLDKLQKAEKLLFKLTRLKLNDEKKI